MRVLDTLLFTMLVSMALSTPQSRPPRPPRPDELASLSPKSTGGKRRPPPPPGTASAVLFNIATSDKEEGAFGSVTGSSGVPVKSNTRWIWDDNCKNDRPPFELGRWIQVRYEDCPIAFEDPTFDYHDSFCGNPNVSPTHNFIDWYSSKMEAMWTYPEYKYCENVPVCLACPALGECGPRGGISSGSGSCTCNGYISTKGQGECKTKYRGKYFCYVDASAKCEKFRSSSGSRYYSFEAC
eukprot:TRINITY_DN5316_c0_g1_i1.p1 TRINITY_DN5316_c0_g1~~TRINITY_DN5316_c0_g1_i1.p1  ORF type:complete len:239 (-),score=49.70 TRINITY_DN5316_c0_g1_i1:80-796(-)